MCRLFLCVAFLILASSIAEAAHRDLFKTCLQSSHCMRYSKFVSFCESSEKKSFHRFVVVKDTIKLPNLNTNNNLAQFQLKNTIDNSTLNMNVQAVSYGIIRITIDEFYPTPLRSRYKLPRDDVLQDTKLENLSSKTNLVVKQDSNALHLVMEMATIKREITISVVFEPFALNTYDEKHQLIQSINSKELLNFERYRKRPEAAESTRNENETVSSEELSRHTEEELVKTGTERLPVDAVEVDDTDSWSSVWIGETDTLPFGPSAVGVDVSFWGASQVFGLSLHSTPLSLPSYSEPYRSWNSDVFEYELDSPMALYGSIPFIFALHSGNRQQRSFSGFLWLNPSDTWITVKKKLTELDESTQSTFLSETGVMDMLILLGPSPQDILLQYYEATGYPAAAPLFSLGKHQSRWNYDNETDVLQISNNFFKYEMPLDAIWLDIEHTNDKRYFTWDKYKFPRPKEMIEEIAKNGQKIIAIVDPHIKVDDNFPVYHTLLKENGFLKNKDNNSIFVGTCWAGNSAYPDFLSPRVREIFQTFYLPKFWNGTDDHNVFLWNDMNEPSVFNKPEITASRGVWHLNNREHREVHNLYGMMYHRTTHEALLKRNSNIRPFVLSRSYFIGSHRFGTFWTGDNSANWDHLKMSIPMLLNLALNGLSFVGADIPGFFKDPSPELMSRWMQLGAWYPFFRSHACDTTKRREPWLFQPHIRDIIRNAIKLRYTLLPTWYTAFMEYALRGYPIIKPIWWNSALTTKDAAIYDFQNKAFIVGDSILVYAVSEPMQNWEEMNQQTSSQSLGVTASEMMKVYLFENDDDTVRYAWYDFHSGQPVLSKATTLEWPVTTDRIPVFVKAGSMLFMKEAARRSTATQHYDPFTIRVYVKDPRNDLVTLATGRVFVDDGLSFDYSKKADFAYDEFTLSQTTKNQLVLANRPLSVALVPSETKNVTFGTNKPSTNLNVNNLVIHGLNRLPKSVTSLVGNINTSLVFQAYKHGGLYELKIKNPQIEIGTQHKIEINF